MNKHPLTLAKLDIGLFRQLSSILNEGNNWEKLLPLTSDYKSTDAACLRRFKNGTKNPGDNVMNDLMENDIYTSDLIRRLEETNLEEALLLLKNPEPIDIVTQPLESLTLKMDEPTKLKLICEAKSFPSVEYQWFKVNEFDPNADLEKHSAKVKLENQCNSLLEITSINEDTSGVYVCNIFHEYCSAFSQPCQVTVLPPTSFDLTETDRIVNEIELPDAPVIVCQPVCPSAKISIGSNLTLACEAVSKLPLLYEWSKDGYVIQTESSGKLEILNLRIEADKFSWKYQCRVYNDKASVLSNCVTVTLVIEDSTQYIATEKVALLIGNQNYTRLQALTSSLDDVLSLAIVLRQAGFKVIALSNLNLVEMSNAVDLFCRMLCQGAYGLFYYGGHGFQQSGQTYMIPVNAREDYLVSHCLCTEDVVERMQVSNQLELCLLILDMCRKDHENSLWTNLERTVHYKPPVRRNTVYAYATSYTCSAYERLGETNGMFMKYLKTHLMKKTTIKKVLDSVKKDFALDSLASARQYPFVAENLALDLGIWDPVIQKDISAAIRINDIFKDVCGVPKQTTIGLPHLKCTLLLEFGLGRAAFCDAMEIKVSLVPHTYNVAFKSNYSKNMTVIKDSDIPAQIAVFKQLQKLQSSLYFTVYVHPKQSIPNMPVLKPRILDEKTFCLGKPLIGKVDLWKRASITFGTVRDPVEQDEDILEASNSTETV